jgi:hypothetical protein
MDYQLPDRMSARLLDETWQVFLVSRAAHVAVALASHYLTHFKSLAERCALMDHRVQPAELLNVAWCELLELVHEAKGATELYPRCAARIRGVMLDYIRAISGSKHPSKTISLQAPVCGDKPNEHPGHEQDPAECVENHDLYTQALHYLTPCEKLVVNLYHGEELTLKQVQVTYGYNIHKTLFALASARKKIGQNIGTTFSRNSSRRNSTVKRPRVDPPSS